MADARRGPAVRVSMPAPGRAPETPPRSPGFSPLGTRHDDGARATDRSPVFPSIGRSVAVPVPNADDCGRQWTNPRNSEIGFFKPSGRGIRRFGRRSIVPWEFADR